ncbi:MAG: MCE family protein [Candidatus Competibacteraceae bacterium]|nr:MCE family protein [Candidatus Competibacteraceae bacterium]
MQSKVNYALVGLFAIVLGAFLVGVVFWLTLGGDKTVYDRYLVYFRESVAGLNPKATVGYRGVQVGRVESIRLDPETPDRVEVVLGIERGTPIRRDTIATLSTRGLTGVATIELSGGGESPPLRNEPGQGLPVLQAGPSLVARLDDALNNILTNVNSLSSRLEQLLDDENQTAISEILRNASAITEALAGRSKNIGQIVVNVETFTSDLAKSSGRLGKALSELAASLEGSGVLSGQIQSAITDFKAAVQSVRKTADTFNQTSRDLSGLAEVGQQELQRLGRVTDPELSILLAQASDLVTTLQRVAELLEQNPRALLLGQPSGRPGPGEK